MGGGATLWRALFHSLLVFPFTLCVPVLLLLFYLFIFLILFIILVFAAAVVGDFG